MANLEDFKDEAGKWVARTTGIERKFTRAGMLFHGVRQRINPKGAKQTQSPLYIGCFSSFEDFQDFAEWCQTQIGYSSGFQLDKDLIFRGNKEYGKHTCVFIPQELNKLLTKRQRFRGALPIGLTWEKNKTSIRVSFTKGGEKVNAGSYQDKETAFCVYKRLKECWIKEQADRWKSQIDPRAYEALMSYEVLITD